MISTGNLQALPDIEQLQRTCKAIAVLDAVLCPEWEYRYYSYNAQWAVGEACATMRNGSGDQYLILFNSYGAIINGFAHEMRPIKLSQTDVPIEFREFMFGEPVSSIGTTFCVWKKHGEKAWQAQNPEFTELDAYGDGSADLLFILDGQPKTYKQWVEDYYELELDSKAVNTIKQVYQGKPLTDEMVIALNPDIEDLEQLKADLEEISYPYKFANEI